MKILYMCIPFIVALWSAREKSLWIALATFSLDLIFVSIVPYCKKRESLWMFILVAFTCVPINIFIAEDILGMWSVFLVKEIFYYLCLVELVLILASIEELVMGFLVRFLYKKQYNLYIEEVGEV